MKNLQDFSISCKKIAGKFAVIIISLPHMYAVSKESAKEDNQCVNMR